jgi:MFS family permease
VVLTVAFATFLVTSLDRLAWANANLLAGKSLGIQVAALGVFVTAFYVGYVSASAVGGFVADRIGPRRCFFLRWRRSRSPPSCSASHRRLSWASRCRG